MNRVEDLIDELYEQRQDAWRDSARGVRLAAAVESGTRLSEPDLTRLVTDTTGPVEAALVTSIARAAGISADVGEWQFDRWRDLRDHHAGSTTARTAPDLVVIDAARTPRIVCECKVDAWVNGGVGYCADDELVYSNQIICYPHACRMHGPLADLVRQAAFVWISPARHHGPLGPWGRKAVNPEDDLERFPQGLERQTAATLRWSPMTWEDLAASVAGVSPGGRVLSRLILTSVA